MTTAVEKALQEQGPSFGHLKVKSDKLDCPIGQKVIAEKNWGSKVRIDLLMVGVVSLFLSAKV